MIVAPRRAAGDGEGGGEGGEHVRGDARCAGGRDAAVALARRLVERRLVACAQASRPAAAPRARAPRSRALSRGRSRGPPPAFPPPPRPLLAQVGEAGSLALKTLARHRAAIGALVADDGAELAEGGELAWTPITANDAYLRWLDEECSAT